MKRLFFHPLCPIVTVGALCALSATARAASIGVDFGDSGNVLAFPELAGVPGFAQANWNAVTTNGTHLSLVDNSGALTTASVTLSSVTLGFTAANASGPDERLNNGVAFSSFDWSFTLGGIPYANYSILVYHLGLIGDTRGITVGSTTYYSFSPNPSGVGYVDNNAGTPFTYNQMTGTVPALPGPAADYALFTGLTGGSQTVSIVGIDGSNVRLVSAVQIIQTVPEPSSALLLLGGLAMRAGSRRAAARR